ncbi:MAG: VirB3 family type IV secretion system protein [Bacteroidetes bacterium]|nr:VirB3 family type IV secretion system protein [Bacteroidota bacterium]
MSDDAPRDLEVDELFVGLTRPATMLGVHFTAFILELMVVNIIFLAIGNPLWFALFPPIHFILYLISSHDPGRFDSLAKYAITNGRCLNRFFWKSTSFSPNSHLALPRQKKPGNFADAKK